MTAVEVSGSPFDAMRQVDANGEFWSARDLMQPLDYERWESFNDAITRASISAANAGQGGDHFRGVPKMVAIGSGAFRQLQDYRLTRFAAYLVAMNGDPRKAKVAEAQAYFAIQARRAEVALPSMDAAALDRRALAQMVIEAEDAREVVELRNRELEGELTQVAPMVEGYKAFLDSDGGRLVREAAKDLGWKESALRAFLLEENLIFSRQIPCGATQYDHYAAYASHFNPVETLVKHRYGNCSHYTLTVTPRGLELIRKRIADRNAAIKREVVRT